MIRSALLTVGFLLSAIAHPGIDTYPRQPVDVLHYDFDLTLSDSTDEIVGRAIVDIKFLADGLKTLELDLVEPSSEHTGKGMTVSSVTILDRVVPYSQSRDRLSIVLPEPSRAGASLPISIAYHGVPVTGLIIGPNRHGDRTFFSDNWPNKARNWLPLIDHISDKATCRFRVNAPSHYQVVANGERIETTNLPGSRTRTVWRESVPIAPWLFAIGVAEFAVERVGDYDHVPIETWVYAKDRGAGFYDFAVPTRDVLAFFSTWIGPYSYEKLANVQSNSVGGGGMEAASNIFYSADAVTGTRSARWRNVIIHEIAHQWFGNAVTERDWDDVWLSEGFATYFTSLFIEHAYGHDEFLAGLKASRKTVLEFDAKNPDYRVVHDRLADMSKVTTVQTYQKGGWTLHMLRGLLGDDKFWAGIRDYYRSYRGANASTDDFRRAMEGAAGVDLKWFFDQWLYRGGVPRISGNWRYDAGGKVVVVELHQTQPGVPFRVPLEVAVGGEGGVVRVERIDLTDRHQQFRIASDQAPATVTLDPNVRVLMGAELVLRSP